ncbi:UNVERIFIED_CONTAM: hypothetical protein FKN15_003651 [Acipenser sinensis]
MPCPVGGAYTCSLCQRHLTKEEVQQRLFLRCRGDGDCDDNPNQTFKCDSCCSEFRYRGNLTGNKTAHRGEKPYRCSVCGAQFNRPANLKTHSRIHSGEKPYPCETCGARFVQCEKCDLHFRHKSQLRLHLRQKHGAITNTKIRYKCGCPVSEYCKQKRAGKLHQKKDSRKHDPPGECVEFGGTETEQKKTKPQQEHLLINGKDAGWLRDLTGDFTASFLVAGAFLLAGTLVLFALPRFFSCSGPQNQCPEPGPITNGTGPSSSSQPEPQNSTEPQAALVTGPSETVTFSGSGQNHSATRVEDANC